MGSYRIRCLEGGEYVEERYTLRCTGHSGLLRAEYDAEQLALNNTEGVFKFYDWLPVRSTIRSLSCPVAFRNEDLAREIGLKDLWIGFTGYYPERNAYVKSCSFKEMEALPTMARIRDCKGGTIVVASAGNTGRAFAQICNEVGMDCIIVVPERSGDRIRISEQNRHAKLLTVRGDYADAIALSDRISSMDGYIPEGGAKNIARRDGMGTVMLEAAVTSGRIPDHYFQAIGSGTGGISAWEASMRLMGDGRFGDRLPMLHLSQNSPFTPMKNAWDAGRREILPEDMPDATHSISKVYADVLTNRSPPYGLKGGVYDAMTACNGKMYSVTNEEAKEAEKLWMEYENALPDPAASVAFASLLKAIQEDRVPKEKMILLNMTGGGYDRVKEDIPLLTIQPFARLDTDISDEELKRIVHE